MPAVFKDWFTNQSQLVPIAIQYDSEEIPHQKINTDAAKLNQLRQWYSTQSLHNE